MGFETLRIGNSETSASIVPARGALVTGLKVGAQEVLYLDRATLEDPAKNVRGGIPVLFPYAGKLVNETLLPANTTMKQHGFGRNKAWTVAEHTASMLRLTLAPDADTRAQYPYEFSAEQTVLALARGLQIELLVGNHGAKPLPLSPGWHPYFTCTAAVKGTVTGNVAGFTADKIGNDREFDFGLPAPQNGRALFSVPGLGKLNLSFSPELRHLQFWSLPGKEFICLEPFFGPANTINTEKRMDLLPGEYRMLWMRIELS